MQPLLPVLLFYLFSRFFLFVFRITGHHFSLYLVLFKAAVDSLVIQRLRHTKRVMAKRRRITADELRSFLRNIFDDVSHCEDSGSEFDDLQTPDLVSNYSCSDDSEQDFSRSFNCGLGLCGHKQHKQPRFQNQREKIITPQEMDDIDCNKYKS